MTPIRRWLAVAVVFLGPCREGTVTSIDKTSGTANLDVGVQAGNLDVNPYYFGTDIPSLQLTACGVTARARHLGNNSEANQFWWCNLPTFVNLTPGEYEVKLS